MNITKSFTIILLFTSITAAQQVDLKKSETMDSVYRHQGINPVINVNNESFDLFVPFNLSLLKSSQFAEGDSSTLWLRTELALSQYVNYTAGSGELKDHMLLPLYNRYLENSKFNPVSYILGIAQTAAVGYMAYRHIKKYGFFK